MRIAGTEIPVNKRLEYALASIYGIGVSLSQKILTKQGIPFDKTVKDLSEQQINGLRTAIEKEYAVEGELKRSIAQNLKRLKDIQCYRGIRHIKKLPVRGQRTKTNNRTRRGNVRITMGSGRKKAEKK